MRNQANKYSCLISFAAAIVTVTVAFLFAGILPGGGSRIVYTDTMEQMTPLSVMLVRHILEGATPFYSFETALGQNTALLNAFCVYSPFTLVFFVIRDPYVATLIVIALKIGFSALFCHLFLQYGMRVDAKKAVFFSLCYALNGYQCEYLLSMNLLDGVYLLPLLMLCLKKAIDTNKCVLLSAVYALCFVVNFYDGFLLGLFSAAALFVVLYLKEGNDFLRKKWAFLQKYVLCVLGAILMSMFILLPAVLFFRSNVGFNSDKQWELLNIFDIFYAAYFGRMPSVYTDIPYLYCGIPVLLLLPLYFCNQRIAAKERRVMAVGLGSLLVAVYVKPVYYFLHAFNRPDGFTARFSFLYIFVMVVLAARAAMYAEHKEGKEGGMWYIVGQVLFCVLVFAMHRFFGEQDINGYSLTVAVLSCALVMVWSGYAVFWRKRKEKGYFEWIAVILVMLELGGNLFLNQKGIGLESEQNWKEYEAQAAAFMRQRDAAVTRDGEGFRAHIGAAPFRNMNALYGFEGMAQYVSSNYSGLNKLMARLGDAVSSVSFAQTGATDLTDMVFGVRYRGTMQNGDETIEGREVPAFEIYERALPMGYMVSPTALENIRFGANVFENQNLLLSYLCGRRMEVYSPASVWGYDGQGVSFEENGERKEIRTLSDDMQGVMIYGIPALGYERAYAYFQHYPYTEEPEERFPAENEARDVEKISPADRKYTGVRQNDVIGDSVIEMTKVEDQFQIALADYEGTDKVYSYVEQYFCYQNEEMLDEAYRLLAAGGWRVEEFEQDHIRAGVTATQEMPVLFISVPYDKGWSATVDGKETEIAPLVNDVFMGIYLTPGAHEVELRYEAPGMREGKMLSACGCICWLLLVLTDYKRQRELKDE